MIQFFILTKSFKKGDVKKLNRVFLHPLFLKKNKLKNENHGIIKKDSAVMLTQLYLPEWQKIL